MSNGGLIHPAAQVEVVLIAGSYVLSASAVRRIGREALERLNGGDQ